MKRWGSPGRRPPANQPGNARGAIPRPRSTAAGMAVRASWRRSKTAASGQPLANNASSRGPNASGSELTELQHWVVRHLQQLRALPRDPVASLEAADRLTGNERVE